MLITAIRVRPIKNSQIIAIASITIDDQLIINDIKVLMIDGILSISFPKSDRAIKNNQNNIVTNSDFYNEIKCAIISKLNEQEDNKMLVNILKYQFIHPTEKEKAKNPLSYWTLVIIAEGVHLNNPKQQSRVDLKFILKKEPTCYADFKEYNLILPDEFDSLVDKEQQKSFIRIAKDLYISSGLSDERYKIPVQDIIF